MNAEGLASLLMQHSFRFDHERELQDAIQVVLERHSVSFEREVHLGRKDIIDFVCAPRIGIEVKIRDGISQITRQLHRYLQSDLIDTLIFATASMRARAILPRELNGKRILFASLGGGIL